LKPFKNKQVKKEIRILGIVAAKNQKTTRIIGTIFKGKIGLDGIISTSTNSSNLTCPIIQMIFDSPHKDQIRIIIIDKKLMPPNISINYHKLELLSSKPVILLNNENSVAHYYWGGIPVYSENISKNYGLQVLNLSSIKPGIVEAIRIASQIASQING
jgi:endonuclease V-like protein UPF0215 family